MATSYRPVLRPMSFWFSEVSSKRRKSHATPCFCRRTLSIGSAYPLGSRFFYRSRLGVYSEFGSSCSYSSDTAAGRSCHFPDTLVHGAAGTLAARAFRHARISFAAFHFEDSGAGNHHLPAWSDRRFLWSERVREVCGAGGCSRAFVLQRSGNLPVVDPCGSSPLGMAGRTSADNSLGSVDHQCFQFN